MSTKALAVPSCPQCRGPTADAEAGQGGNTGGQGCDDAGECSNSGQVSTVCRVSLHWRCALARGRVPPQGKIEYVKVRNTLPPKGPRLRVADAAQVTAGDLLAVRLAKPHFPVLPRYSAE